MNRVEEELRKHAIEAQSLSAFYAEKARIATEEYQQYKMNQTTHDKIKNNIPHTKGTRKKRTIRLKYKRV